MLHHLAVLDSPLCVCHVAAFHQQFKDQLDTVLVGHEPSACLQCQHSAAAGAGAGAMISAVARSLLGGFTRAASGGVESPDTAAGDSAASDRPPRSRSRSPALASMNSGDSNLSAAAARADGADSADGEPKARKRFSLPRKFAVRLPSKGRRRAGTADVVSTPPAVDVDDPGTPTRGRSASAVAASVVVGGGVGADGTTDGEGGGIDSAAPAPSDGDSGGANRKRSQSKTQRFMRYEGYDVPPR